MASIAGTFETHDTNWEPCSDPGHAKPGCPSFELVVRRYCQVPKFLSEDGMGRLVHEETYVAVKEREKARERKRAEAARAALAKKTSKSTAQSQAKTITQTDVETIVDEDDWVVQTIGMDGTQQREASPMWRQIVNVAFQFAKALVK